MDYEFRTDAPNGLSQLDSLFAQVRHEAQQGRVCNVLVLKTGKTQITIEPMPKGSAMPIKLAEPPVILDDPSDRVTSSMETEPEDPTNLIDEREAIE